MTLQAWMLANQSTSSFRGGYELLGIAVWVGVAILTVALLILMRTRWGQVRPLSKCVVLSVFAHLLLVLFASTTHLLERDTPAEKEEAIEVAFITTDHPPGESGKAEDPTPWDGLASQESLEPDPVNTKRMEVDTEPMSRSDQHRVREPATPRPPEDTVPLPTPPRKTPPRHVPAPEALAASKIEAAPIEKPDVKKRASPAPVERPKPPGPERMDSPAPDPPSSQSRGRARLPTDFLSVGSRMQELADVEPRSETAEALAGTLDQLSQSDNQNRSLEEMVGVVQPSPPAKEEENGKASDDLVTLPRRHEITTVPAAALIKEAVAAKPRRLGDGQPLPTPYRMRAAPQDQDVATGLGGTTQAAMAVEAALKWLVSEQERDGRWDASRWGSGIEHRIAGHDRQGAGTDADTGITGLVVLALLANGQTHLEGVYRQNVQRGLEFLLRSQAGDGNLAGDARLYARMYSHGMALLAVSEALAMTGDVRMKPYVERGVRYTVDAQNSTTGGWRYQPSDAGDMSQFGWQVMALKSAALAGIDVPRETREGMLEFLQRCEQGRHGGLSGYRAGSAASRPMTAEALVCRYFLDLAPSDDLVDEATEFLMGELPQTGQPNYYYWYYGALALFQVQGADWEKWNEAMQRQLLRLQRTDGHLAGSWDPDSVWGAYGGRVYTTAMATLCLEVYYRYLPTTLLSSASADSLRPR